MKPDSQVVCGCPESGSRLRWRTAVDLYHSQNFSIGRPQVLEYAENASTGLGLRSVRGRDSGSLASRPELDRPAFGALLALLIYRHVVQQPSKPRDEPVLQAQRSASPQCPFERRLESVLGLVRIAQPNGEPAVEALALLNQAIDRICAQR